MAIRRKGDRWLVEFMQSGHRIFKRLPENATRADAVRYEAQLRREIFDQATLGKQPQIGLDYAIREWLKESVTGRKSEHATRSHASHVQGRIGSAFQGSNTSDAKRVADAIAADGSTAAATRNRRLCILKAVAKYAWKKGWTHENLSARISLLPENNARQIYLTASQVDALLAATPKESLCFVALAVYTGLRQGEILALSADCVAQNKIQVRDSKGGEPRTVPVVPALRPYLSGIPFTLHKRTLYKGFEVARAAIGMPHLHYHDLRHTTASLMIQAGVPLYTVGEILGHKSTQTTKRYAHLSEGNKREALERAFPSKLQQKKRKPMKTKKRATD